MISSYNKCAMLAATFLFTAGLFGAEAHAFRGQERGGIIRGYKGQERGGITPDFKGQERGGKLRSQERGGIIRSVDLVRLEEALKEELVTLNTVELLSADELRRRNMILAELAAVAAEKEVFLNALIETGSVPRPNMN